MLNRYLLFLLLIFTVSCGSTIPEDARPSVNSYSGDLSELSALPVIYEEPETSE